MIVAIDGPAGSGKSSTARAVAERLGFLHLDSGAFYRAVTWASLQQAIPQQQWSALTPAELDALNVEARPSGISFAMYVDGRDVSTEIRSPEVNANVPAMATVPAVRDWLLGTLRTLAGSHDVVADGRDIGTVVFPDAELKVFLVADPRERARRRLLQMNASVDDKALDAEVARIAERDRIDSSRDTAPLVAAEDAVVLDTTHLGFEEQVARIVELCQERNAPGR